MSFGLDADQRQQLRAAVEHAPAGRGEAVSAPVAASVTVDAHGADGQPLRDPILPGWALS